MPLSVSLPLSLTQLLWQGQPRQCNDTQAEVGLLPKVGQRGCVFAAYFSVWSGHPLQFKSPFPLAVRCPSPRPALTP